MFTPLFGYDYLMSEESLFEPGMPRVAVCKLPLQEALHCFSSLRADAGHGEQRPQVHCQMLPWLYTATHRVSKVPLIITLTHESRSDTSAKIAKAMLVNYCYKVSVKGQHGQKTGCHHLLWSTSLGITRCQQIMQDFPRNDMAL